MTTNGSQNMPEPELVQVHWDDLPADLPKRASQLVSPYSTPLFLDRKLAGSGTFIKCGEIHGILTAHHVIHNPNDRRRRFDFKSGSDQKLMLGITNIAHRFEIEMRLLTYVDIGVPSNDYSGPDLSVIVIPNSMPQLAEIRARKRFYDISTRQEEHLAAALEDIGFWVVIGYPSCEEAIEGPSHGFDYVIKSVGITACTSLSAREEDGDFDFLRLGVRRTNTEDQTADFRGVSGGGVWRLPLEKRYSDPPSKARFGSEVLAGVAFYQTAIVDNCCEIRSHAGKSIYQKVHEKLIGLN
jgi:hypothetical protein